MAKIGLKFPVAAVINGYGADGKPTYNQGFIIGKAISAEKSIESNDNQLYGDDAIAESDTSTWQSLLHPEKGTEIMDLEHIQNQMSAEGLVLPEDFSVDRSTAVFSKDRSITEVELQIDIGKEQYRATFTYLNDESGNGFIDFKIKDEFP